ncbi:MAG: hypothetical protein IJB50_01890 [Clostridia bacterium]|nr:hypothetical protein [Clostridia bacterium]
MTVQIKKYNDLPICEKEILRYAGCCDATDDVVKLLNSCLDEAKDKLAYSVCYSTLDVKVFDNLCDFGLFSVKSSDLAKSLAGCEKVVLFAATIGIDIDRLIKKYTRISPSRALMFQSIGTEQIEALCDAFCKEMGYARRFSPGYGDLSLDVQKNIFDVLNCTKLIGLSLNDSLLISPSKSVTAFAFTGEPQKNKCEFCKKMNCALRGAL